MRKKMILPIILAVACVSTFVCVRGVAAYMTSHGNKTNPITAGAVNTELHQTLVLPHDGALQSSDRVREKIYVSNKGPNDAYIRIYADFKDSYTDAYVTVDYNTDDYVYNRDDGYWYCREAVTAGEDTPELIEGITVSENLPEDYTLDLDMVVYQEAYQADGFTDYQAAWDDFSKNRP